jgi:uncharacterized protein (TIRG00374 family)
MQKRLRVLLGIIISIVFLYLVVRGIDPKELWLVFRAADYRFVIPAAVLIMLISWVRAARWRLLIYPDRDVPLPRLFSLVNIGYMFNNVLPAKAGELVRGYLLGRSISGGIPQAFSSLLVERLLDVLALLTCVVLLGFFVTIPSWAAQAGQLLGAVALTGTVVLVILARFGDKGLELVWRYVERIPWVGRPRVKQALHNLIAGFRPLSTLKLLPGIILWSVVIWSGYALLNYLMLAAFRLTYLPFAAAALVLCATGFGMVVPSSPGAMGVFEAAVVLALSVYGVEQAQAFGYGFGLHMLTNIALILLGLWGLRSESLTWKSARAQVADLQDKPAVAAETELHGEP